MSAEYVYVWEVKYRALGADAPVSDYYCRKDNAVKAKQDLENQGLYVDEPCKAPLSMCFLRKTRPDAIKDADEKIERLIWG